MATQKKKAKAKKKNKGGRPPIYNADFHPQEYIRLAKTGMNNVEIAAEWELHTEIIYDWCRKHKEFSHAYKKGKTACERWYANFGKNIAAGKVKGANVTAYIWLTKNMVGWRDKVEHTHEINEFDFDIEDDE